MSLDLLVVILGALFFGGFAFLAQPMIGWMQAWRVCCGIGCAIIIAARLLV